MWRFRCCRRENVFPHCSHLSPVWVNMWVFRLDCCANVFPHCSHWFGLSPVWVTMWRCRCRCFANAFLHIGHCIIFAAFRYFWELSDDMHVDVALNVTLSQLNYKCMYCWNWTNVKHFWVMVFYFQTVIKFLNLSQWRGLINSHVTKWLISWQWSRTVLICCIKVQSSMWIL